MYAENSRRITKGATRQVGHALHVPGTPTSRNPAPLAAMKRPGNRYSLSLSTGFCQRLVQQ